MEVMIICRPGETREAELIRRFAKALLPEAQIKEMEGSDDDFMVCD